jgi:hypothetical protein
VIRKATSHDFRAVLGLWERSRSGHAKTPDSLEALRQAEGLWRAAGYKDDVEIGRWVRSLP